MAPLRAQPDDEVMSSANEHDTSPIVQSDRPVACVAPDIEVLDTKPGWKFKTSLERTESLNEGLKILRDALGNLSKNTNTKIDSVWTRFRIEDEQISTLLKQMEELQKRIPRTITPTLSMWEDNDPKYLQLRNITNEHWRKLTKPRKCCRRAADACGEVG